MATCFTLVSGFAYVPTVKTEATLAPKRRQIFKGLYGVLSQKIEVLICIHTFHTRFMKSTQETSSYRNLSLDWSRYFQRCMEPTSSLLMHKSSPLGNLILPAALSICG
jgi:hypothetical protein